MILPFETGDDSDPSVIMNVVPSLAIPFDTKKRAPFKVVFETVKLSELLGLRENGIEEVKATPTADVGKCEYEIVEPEYPKDVEGIRQIFMEYASSIGIDLGF